MGIATPESSSFEFFTQYGNAVSIKEFVSVTRRFDVLWQTQDLILNCLFWINPILLQVLNLISEHLQSSLCDGSRQPAKRHMLQSCYVNGEVHPWLSCAGLFTRLLTG